MVHAWHRHRPHHEQMMDSPSLSSLPLLVKVRAAGCLLMTGVRLPAGCCCRAEPLPLLLAGTPLPGVGVTPEPNLGRLPLTRAGAPCTRAKSTWVRLWW